MILIIQIVVGIIIGEALWSCFEMFKDLIIAPEVKRWNTLRLVKKMEKEKDSPLKLNVDDAGKVKVEFKGEAK